ncbi:double-strand break repair helicase AddA [Anderseniella sp. Alg231-50]|uniref:double-strand break repair helicase AddA n=1 Tax=Anderseniella sp. Alg231-50 TaxID=1922226 RepID=UPI00307B2ED4
MSATAEFETARRQQDLASGPEVSAFVPANAGAGKTHVLVGRVIRLLLNGVQPERILCLTYTRAAAAEMSERLFEKLSGWIARDDRELSALIRKDIAQSDMEVRNLDEARRLFTRALETPGGLKVQTIHAFCERLLQRFPIEAGVVPGFHVLSTTDSRDLMALARAQVLTRDDDRVRDAVSTITPFANEQAFSGLLHELQKHASKLLAAFGTRETFPQLTAQLNLLFGLTGEETSQDIAQEFAAQLDKSSLLHAATLMASDAAVTNTNQAALITRLLEAQSPQDVLSIARQIALTGKGKPKGDTALVTRKLDERHPECREALLKLRELLLAALESVNALLIVRSTSALVYLGLEIIATFNKLKQNLAAYDFEDLIHQTVDLLHHNADAAWVLYKLDGGLDHILIDEAQDTSPDQWQIINALTEEFFAGEGARGGLARTMFAVGDRKQSIYSFQGADPREFDKQAGLYETLISNAGETYREVPLEHSFRSSELVLHAVDLVFRRDDASKGVTSEIQPEVRHLPIRKGERGLVEIWDLERGQSDDDVQHWAPKSGEIVDPPHLVMARRIAATIAAWTQNQPPEMLKENRPVRPSDILILVRQRSYLMAAIVRALKEAGVPVAGADRLKLLDHIAIQDLMALAQACILPQDDLNLAGVLKSPLFTHDDGVTRFDDDSDLFALAHQREPGSIWNRLEKAARAGKPYSGAFEQLTRWRKQAARSGVFNFYSAVLSRDGGRRALLGGLGPEAADPVDAFLQLALEYEQQHAPSLAGFLAWLEATQADIRRDMDQAGGEVRVMTVHGAKGLEAPIVFLPDTCSAPEARKIDSVLFTETHIPVWRLKSDYATGVTDALRDKAFAGLMEEYNRLLYVAMTRARYRLYVCGFVKPRSKTAPADAPDASWYAMMHAALTGSETPLLQQHVDSNDVRTWRAGQPQVSDDKESSADSAAEASVPPEWAHAPARSVAAPSRWLAPSRMDAAGETDEGWSGETALSPLAPRTDIRFRRGQLVHRLLQSLPELPEEQREASAHRFLAANGVTEPELDTTVSEIMMLFADARFAAVFSAAARPEVSIAAMIDLPDQERFGLTGQIDRLLVEPDRVLVVDFKTNRPPPDSVNDVPDLYLRQLAAYSKALQRVYPGRIIECALLWTDAPALMPVPAAMLDEAWQGSAITTA